MRQADTGGFLRLWWLLLALAASSLATSHQVHSSQKSLQNQFSSAPVSGYGTVVSASLQNRVAIAAVAGKRLRLEIEHEEGTLHPGDLLVFDGIFQAPEKLRNPHDFDEERYFRSQGWLGTVVAGRIAVDHRVHANRPRYLLHRLRSWFGHRIDTRIESPANRHLLKALLLGNRTELDDNMVSSFRQTGLSHILAISGLHVGMIAGIVHFLTGAIFLRLPMHSGGKRWMSAALSLFLVWTFAAIVGLSASVFRACVMVSLVLISTALNRHVPLSRTLGVAFCAVLFFHPDDLLSPGFQLSFLAVGFICLGLIHQKQKAMERPFLSYVKATMGVTISASIGTAPVLSYYFGFVPLATLLFSPIIVPLVSFVLPLSMAAILLPLPGNAFSIMAEMGLDWMVALSTMGARADWIPAWNGPIQHVPPVIWMSLLGFLLWKTWHRAPIRRLCLLCTLVLSLLSAMSKPETVRVTVLDAGQGDAMVVEAPGLKGLVIDTGPDKRSGKAVYNHLKARGLLSSYSVLLSHSHADHTGGLIFMVEEGQKTNREPSEILHGGWISTDLPAVRPVGPGTMLNLGRDVRIYVLGPEAKGGDNDHSVILLLQYGHSRMLFMGDAEHDSEQHMVARYWPILKPHVLKAGHHGSRTSTSVELMRVIKPDITVISAGRKNRFGHPHDDVVKRLQKAGSDVRQTKKEGAIQIELDGRSAAVLTWTR